LSRLAVSKVVRTRATLTIPASAAQVSQNSGNRG